MAESCADFFGGRSLCSVAALTVYDMCKALAHDIVIKEIKLVNKTGGKSDFQVQRPAASQ